MTRSAIVARTLTRRLCRAGLAEVLDPVIVSVAAAVSSWRELIPVAARLAAEPTALLPVRRLTVRRLTVRLLTATLAWVVHGPDWERSARVIGAKRGRIGEPWIRFGGKTPAGRTAWPSVIVLGVGPPRTLLVLRPSRCHNDCYSRD